MSARTGNAATARASPLASPEAALSRLSKLQREVGRTALQAEHLSDCVRKFVEVYTRDALLIHDPRFVRFQEGLKLAQAALADFTGEELARERGEVTERLHDVGLPPWAETARLVSATEKTLMTEDLSLGVAKKRLDVLFRFFVENAPSTEGDFLAAADSGAGWADEYRLLASPHTRQMLVRHEPRTALARYIKSMPSVPRIPELGALFDRTAAALHEAAALLSEAQNASSRDLQRTRNGAAESGRNARSYAEGRDIGPPVRPTELMLLAAIHELPGERFDGDRQHYERSLDAWRQALKRAPDSGAAAPSTLSGGPSGTGS